MLERYMPELPEVESIRSQLHKFLVGHKILDVEIRHQKVISGDQKELAGAKIKDVKRFAKVLSIDLSNNVSILTHIKLTGQFVYRGPNLKNPPPMSKKIVGGAPGPHTHVIFKLDRGGNLYYNDIRRFGWIRILKTPDVEGTGFVGKLGPEPFGSATKKPAKLTLELFGEILGATKRAVKVVIMDQAKMGGIGNIYANDALWLAKIDPKKPSNTLGKKEASGLYEAILKVLKKGLEMGGASELSFVTPDGSEGNYQKHFLVYGKQGRLCPRCKKDKIIKTTLGGRGTYFCPNCQK